MLYNSINGLPIGSSFKINNGVTAVKSRKDTVVLENGSVYRFEPIGENVKFIKVT